MKENKFYYLYLIVIGVVFYTMNHYTPLFSDDWHYNFIYGTHERISSVTDVIKSQYIHYFQVNGRFVPHFFIQLFDGILGKEWFNFVNTLFFIAYLYLLSYTLKRYCPSFYISTSLALFLTFLLPGFANNLLWMSGACNYLWVAVFLLSFNLLLISKKSYSPKTYPLLFITGLVCGWTNEALVIGLGTGYFFHFLLNRKEITTSRMILLSGFYIGAMFLVFSPGSIHRASLSTNNINGIADIIRSYLSSLIAMSNLRIMFLLLIIGFIMTIKGQIKFGSFIKKNQVLITATIITFLFVTLTRHSSGHSRFGIELFSLILICILVLPQYRRICAYHILNIIIALVSGFCIYFMKAKNEDYQNVVAQIEANNGNIILTNAVSVPSFFEQYLISYNFPEFSDFYSGFISTSWGNQMIAKHFNRSELTFLPESFVRSVHDNPQMYQEFHTSPQIPFYAKTIESDSINKVTFELNPTDYSSLPFYIRPFADKMERYSSNSIASEQYTTIKIQEMDFILVLKNPFIDNRVKTIKIE